MTPSGGQARTGTGRLRRAALALAVLGLAAGTLGLARSGRLVRGQEPPATATASPSPSGLGGFWLPPLIESASPSAAAPLPPLLGSPSPTSAFLPPPLLTPSPSPEFFRPPETTTVSPPLFTPAPPLHAESPAPPSSPPPPLAAASPSSPPPTPPEVLHKAQVDALVALGDELYRDRRLAEARAEYERAFQLLPERPDVLIGLARARGALGERKEADEFLALAAGILGSPEAPALLAARGTLELEAGRAEEAWPLLRRAVAVESPPALWLRDLGEAYLLCRERDFALYELRRAHDADPRDKRTLRLIFEAEQSLGRSRETLDPLLTGILALDGRDAWAYCELGRLELADSDRPKARRAFEQAVAADPGYWPAQLELGKMLRIQGERDAARTCFQRVLAAKPDEPEARAALDALDAEEQEGPASWADPRR